MCFTADFILRLFGMVLVNNSSYFWSKSLAGCLKNSRQSSKSKHEILVLNHHYLLYSSRLFLPCSREISTTVEIFISIDKAAYRCHEEWDRRFRASLLRTRSWWCLAMNDLMLMRFLFLKKFMSYCDLGRKNNNADIFFGNSFKIKYFVSDVVQTRG